MGHSALLPIRLLNGSGLEKPIDPAVAADVCSQRRPERSGAERVAMSGRFRRGGLQFEHFSDTKPEPRCGTCRQFE
jgi:hypothetical protein